MHRFLDLLIRMLPVLVALINALNEAFKNNTNPALTPEEIGQAETAIRVVKAPLDQLHDTLLAHNNKDL